MARFGYSHHSCHQLQWHISGVSADMGGVSAGGMYGLAALAGRATVAGVAVHLSRDETSRPKSNNLFNPYIVTHFSCQLLVLAMNGLSIKRSRYKVK